MITPLSLKDLAKQFDWQLQGASTKFSAVSKDTRTLQAGDLYVALIGDNFDGHDFVSQAQQAGACAALVSKIVDCDLPQLLVDDTRVGLAMLANATCQQFTGKLIGLTGSAGKTTTKEMLAEILSQAGSVLATRGNLNNEIGVPLTLLALQASHDYAVIEMGAGRPGDIRYLVNIAQPDIAILLNAKAVHLDGMGSVAGVAQTKSEIYEGLSSQSYAVVNLDDDYAEQWISRIENANVITFGFNEAAVVRATKTKLAANSTTFMLIVNGEQASVELPVPGAHNIYNAMAAAAAASCAGLSITQIADGLTNFGGVNARLKKSEGVNRSTIIDDTYNANPDAMKAAIDVLKMSEGRHTLVVGDMGELGENAEQYHFDIGEYAQQQGIDSLLAVGELSRHVVKGFGDAGQWFSSKQALAEQLATELQQQDVVLVKGSRSAQMEQVVNLLLAPASDNKVES